MGRVSWYRVPGVSRSESCISGWRLELNRGRQQQGRIVERGTQCHIKQRLEPSRLYLLGWIGYRMPCMQYAGRVLSRIRLITARGRGNGRTGEAGERMRDMDEHLAVRQTEMLKEDCRSADQRSTDPQIHRASDFGIVSTAGSRFSDQAVRQRGSGRLVPIQLIREMAERDRQGYDRC